MSVVGGIVWPDRTSYTLEIDDSKSGLIHILNGSLFAELNGDSLIRTAHDGRATELHCTTNRVVVARTHSSQ